MGSSGFLFIVSSVLIIASGFEAAARSESYAKCFVPRAKSCEHWLGNTIMDRASSRMRIVVSLNGGAREKEKGTPHWEPELPTGYVRSRTIRMMWYIPFAVSILSFWTFPLTSLCFHKVAQWASCNTWFPHTQEGVNLQTNVIVRQSNSMAIVEKFYFLSADILVRPDFSLAFTYDSGRRKSSTDQVCSAALILICA